MTNWLTGLIKFVSPAEAQRAHIALLEAQIRELQSLVENQARTIAEVRAENADLKLQGNLPQKEIKIFTHSERLEEVREKILVLISERGELTQAEVANAISLGEQLVLHHLEGLQEASMVRVNVRTKAWKVNPGGRDYLNHHCLLA